MRLIVSSLEDTASQNILNNLLEYGWESTGEWQESPIYGREDDRMVTVNRHHIYAEGIDVELSGILGPIDHMVFISKHASKAGIHSLTVHPIGNFGKAKFGGKDRKLVPPAPHEMTGALRALHDIATGKGLTREYQVSFEATHHGPLLETPAYYIEIGSDQGSWSDVRAGEVIGMTLMEPETCKKTSCPIIFGIGGGHYAPEFTDLARRRKVSMGHMVPGWALKELDRELFGMGLAQSQAEMVMISKDVGEEMLNKIESWCHEMGVRLVDEASLKRL